MMELFEQKNERIHPIELPDSDEEKEKKVIKGTNNNLCNITIINQKLEKIQKENKNLKNTNEMLKKAINNMVIHSKKKNNFDTVKEEIQNDIATDGKNRNMSYVDMILEIPKMKKENDENLMKISKLEQNIRSFTIKHENLRRTNNELETKVHQYEEEFKILKEDQLKQKQVIQINEEKNKENEKMIKEINNLTNQNDFLKTKNEKLTKNLQKFSQENQNLKNENERIKNITYDEKVKQLLEEIDDKNSKIKEQEVIIQNLQSENETIKLLNIDKINQLKIQSDNIEEYKRDLSQIQNNNLDLQNKIELLQKEKDKINISLQNLSKENEKILYENQELRKENLTYESEFKNLTERLIIIQNEKNKNENYFLEQISLLQKEKNYYEHSCTELQNMKTVSLNERLDNPEINNNDKYDMALKEIMKIKKENKQILQCNEQLKNDVDNVIKENNFYFSLIKRISSFHIEDNQIKEKVDELLNIYSSILKLNKEKRKIKNQLASYTLFIEEMNNSNQIINSKVSYNFRNFEEISILQNELINLENQRANLTPKFIELDNAFNCK